MSASNESASSAAIGAAKAAVAAIEHASPMVHRFGVMFFHKGTIPNQIDIRFQKVRGLSVELETMALQEGGQNLCTQRLPVRISHSNLVLERGYTLGSKLVDEVEETFTRFSFNPGNILITLFNPVGLPVTAWLVIGAYPVKWTTSDLDATQKSVVIETLEFTYARIQMLRI